MSQNASPHDRHPAKRHVHQVDDSSRANSPLLAREEREEDEEESDDDQQALLSADEGRRRQSGDNNKPIEHRGLRNRTHVSNWQYMRAIIYETMPTLLLGLVGTFLTGELLELLAAWKAFKDIDELLIIVPMLLNLKGNLEMNLSARLSTAANMGDLDTRIVRRHLIFGNLSLLQVQALLVSCLAAAMAFLVGLILPDPTSPEPSKRTTISTASNLILELVTRTTRPSHHPPIHRPPKDTQSGPREFFIVLLIAQTAASLSSLILGSFMCSLVLLCRYYKLNPDNIAPAVASALGDLLTLTLLGLSSHFIYPLPLIGLFLVQSLYIILLLISIYLTLKNPRIKGLLKEGWSPLIGAMIISSGTGMFLDSFVGKYKDYGLVSIAQDGIPGSVGSVYVSRLSTALHEAVGHSQHQRGDGHDHHENHTHHPATASATILTNEEEGRRWRPLFEPKNEATRMGLEEARPRVSGLTLYLVTVPVQILFLAAAYASKWLDLPAIWALGFVIFFGATVVSSLLLSHYLTLFLWNRDFDPDTYALPLQSAMVDVFGQTFLVTCYEIVGFLGGAVLKDKSHNGKRGIR